MNLAKSIKLELEEDFVGLWQLYNEARNAKIKENLIPQLVLDTVHELLINTNILVGIFHQNKFVEWDCHRSEIINRIIYELQKLNREPNIGDICWFYLKK